MAAGDVVHVRSAHWLGWRRERGWPAPGGAPGGLRGAAPRRPRGPAARQAGHHGPARRHPGRRGVAAVGPQVLARAGLPERRGRRRDVHRGRPDGPDGRRPAGARAGARRDDGAGDDPRVRPHHRPARGLADPADGRGARRPRSWRRRSTRPTPAPCPTSRPPRPPRASSPTWPTSSSRCSSTPGGGTSPPRSRACSPTPTRSSPTRACGGSSGSPTWSTSPRWCAG